MSFIELDFAAAQPLHRRHSYL